MSNRHWLRFAPTLAVLAALPLAALNAADIIILNGDAAGVGFNDKTAVEPVGGNDGTTLGEQRLNVYNAVAAYWGSQINSDVPIQVYATWEPLTCRSNSAILGAAGPTNIFRDFDGSVLSGHWYQAALANKLAGQALNDPSPLYKNQRADIRARFNVSIGTKACPSFPPFYLGLDNNHGDLTDFYVVLLHELGHGLGFATVTSGQDGSLIDGRPSIFDYFIYDNSFGLHWDQMTDDQRAVSARNALQVGWDGPNVIGAVPTALKAGVPELAVATSTGSASLLVGTASFGPPLDSPGVSGVLQPLSTLACDPLSAADASAVNGKIALIDRGNCTFVTKTLNAQAAGALGVVIADNVPGSPPPGLGGDSDAVTIPAVRITLDDGFVLRTIAAGDTITATLDFNLARRVGADQQNRALLYTPSSYQSGSSVSHFDVSATPNLLMEPNINDDLKHSVVAPDDLTLLLLLDIGWN